jgi:hypothetical protein
MIETPQRLLAPWMEYLDREEQRPKAIEHQLARLTFEVVRLSKGLAQDTSPTNIEDFLPAYNSPEPQEEPAVRKFSQEPPGPATAEDVANFRKSRLARQSRLAQKPTRKPDND